MLVTACRHYKAESLTQTDFEWFKRSVAKVIYSNKPKPSITEMKNPEEKVTDDHLVLVHSSWRAPHKDSEYAGEMYQIHVIVYGSDSALDRIQSVIYYLDPAYGKRAEQTSVIREKNFELKELANGYSVVRAKINIKGRKEPVYLSRFINLTQSGPWLKYEFMK